MVTKTGLEIEIGVLTPDREDAAELGRLREAEWVPELRLTSSEDAIVVTASLVRGFGGCVGVCKVCRVGNAECQIEALAVAPSSRQRGIAGSLIDFVTSASFWEGDDPEDVQYTAKVPRYKQPTATRAVREFFTSRGVSLL